MNRQKKRVKVLIVDDEIGIRELLSEILIDERYVVVTAHDAQSANQMRQQEVPDIILLDIWMPDMDGISLLHHWTEAGYPKVPVIVMSGHATIDTAVEATRLGALEVLEKPITTERLFKAMEKAKLYQHKQAFNILLQQTDFGKTSAMRQFKEHLLKASVQSKLLTMVGVINCGAIFYSRFLTQPQKPIITIDNGSALEGNIADIVGRAEDGLVIVRLVNVLNTIQQNGLIGLIREISKTDARIVLVTTQSPVQMSEQGSYNATLLALLSRQVVYVPSLDTCSTDLPRIIEMICEQLTHSGALAKRTLTPAAVEALAQHHYEEDFAELMSAIRTLLLYSQSDEIDVATAKSVLRHLSGFSFMRNMFDKVHSMSLREARDYFEREYFVRLINTTNGNMQQAAKIAGLERTYFYRKLKQYVGSDGAEAGE